MQYSNRKFRYFLFIAQLFTFSLLQGQTLHIYEKDSKFPIDRVLVYNESENIFLYTDKNGSVDLSDFSDQDPIFFQHIAYINEVFLKSALASKNFKLFLENSSEQLQEVVLSASKSEEESKRIAEQVSVITQYEIQEISPQTSADLLAATPGVKVQKSQFGGGSPVLRGMEANRVLIVVDGIRLNNAIYRKGHLQNSISVSPNVLARTEVLFGPSSIIYGSDALGGVIHYYTKKPELSEVAYFNSNLLTRYSSVNNEITSSYSGEYCNDTWAGLTAISFSQFGDLEMGKNRTHGFNDWGKVPLYSNNSNTFYNENPVVNTDKSLQRNTGYKQIDLLQKIIFPLSKTTELNFNLQYSNTTDIPRFDKLTEYKDGELKYAEWYYGPQKRILLASQLRLNPQKKYLEKGILTLAYQDIYESRRDRKFTSLKKYFRDENVKVWSLTGDFHVPLVPNEKRILSYGFETSYNKVNSKAIGKTLVVDGNQVIGYTDPFNIQSRFPDGGSSYTNFAFYTDYRLDHNKKGTLNIGIRYTNTTLKAKWIDASFILLPQMDITLQNDAVSGTIAYIYKPKQQWKISGILSSGFRSPNIDDIGKIREKRGKVSVPNTNLKPEYAYNAEIGLLHNFNKKSWLSFNTYYTLLHRYINRDFYSIDGESSLLYDGEWTTTIANVNKGDAYIIGGTLNLHTKLSEHLTFNTTATYTKGATLDTDEPLSSIPPIFGTSSFSYKRNKWNLILVHRFNTHKKSIDYNIPEGIDNIEETPIINPSSPDPTVKYYGSPSWNTWNFSGQYKISPTINANLHLDNIFDIHYKEFASGVSAPGRNLSITLNFRF